MSKILIVEDIADNAELARRVLAARGYEVIEAADAATGLEMATAHHPDAILLDLGLPDVDGQTLVGWLRAVPDLAHIPIIVCSAWPEETARRMVEAYACDGYISKPISVSTFADQIAGFIR